MEFFLLKIFFFRKAISEKRREVKEQDNPDALKVKPNTIRTTFCHVTVE